MNYWKPLGLESRSKKNPVLKTRQETRFSVTRVEQASSTLNDSYPPCPPRPPPFATAMRACAPLFLVKSRSMARLFLDVLEKFSVRQLAEAAIRGARVSEICC